MNKVLVSVILAGAMTIMAFAGVSPIGAQGGMDVPDPPQNLVAWVVTDAGVSYISLNWDPPADDGGSPLTGYDVYGADDSGGPYSHLGSLPAGTTDFVDGGVGNGQTRYYVVTATNSVGESGVSNEASATTFDVPDPPQNLDASPGPNAGEISLTWDPPADDGGSAVTDYEVYGADDSGGPYSLLGWDSMSFVESGLDNGQTRYYVVIALNDMGSSGESNEASATTFDVPSAPMDPQAAPGSSMGDIVISWSPPADDGGMPFVGYTLWRSASEDGPFTERASVGSGITEFTDGGSLLTTFYYYVTATNGVGGGDPSETVCSKPYPWISIGDDNLCGVPSP